MVLRRRPAARAVPAPAPPSTGRPAPSGRIPRRSTPPAPRGGREPGNVRLGRLIEEALAQRLGPGEIAPLELPIVVACRDLYADTIGQLPLVAYRNGLIRPDQPAIVVRPDPGEPRWLSMHRLVNNLTGRGYVWLMPVANYISGEPAAVRVLDADKVSGIFDPEGRLVDVYYLGDRYDPGPDGIIWLPYRVDRAGSLGTSPLAGCWRAVEYLCALWQMCGSFWEAGFPSLAVLIAQTLGKGQADELKAQVLSAWSRRHEPAIIDKGGRVEALGNSAVESQLVESIAVANTEIARVFGVMPSIVNVTAGDSLTYATTEGEYQKWLRIGLGSYLMRIEAGFDDLTVHGTTTRFDTSELLRSDAEARAAYYTAGLAAGWLTVAEVRRREGLPPDPSLDQPAPPAGATAAAVVADPPQSVVTP